MGTSHPTAERLRELLGPEAVKHGLELVWTEVSGPKGRPVLRIYLDRQGGIDLDSISDANRWISDVLESDPPMIGPYVLEVSSPGIDRPLGTPEDFSRFVGERAEVKTADPIEGRRKFTGLIETFERGEVVLRIEETAYRIPFDAIAKANLKPDIDFASDKERA